MKEEGSSRLLEQILMLWFSNTSGDKNKKENVPHRFKKKKKGQINPVTFFDSLAAWQACIHLMGTNTSSMPLSFCKVSCTTLVICIFFNSTFFEETRQIWSCLNYCDGGQQQFEQQCSRQALNYFQRNSLKILYEVSQKPDFSGHFS